MKKALSFLLALFMVLVGFSAIAEEAANAVTTTDELTLMFEKPVHYILYDLEGDGYELSSLTIDKIELYTLPANSSYNCTYLYGGKRYTEENITDDKPIIAVYFTSKNKFGVSSSDVAVKFFRYGYDVVIERIDAGEHISYYLASSFPGGIDGWPTALLIGTLNDQFPWTISELDIDYLLDSYDASVFN